MPCPPLPQNRESRRASGPNFSRTLCTFELIVKRCFAEPERFREFRCVSARGDRMPQLNPRWAAETRRVSSRLNPQPSKTEGMRQPTARFFQSVRKPYAKPFQNMPLTS
jgi:hypothetical protein